MIVLDVCNSFGGGDIVDSKVIKFDRWENMRL